MNLLSKKKRKKQEATYHECDLCKGLHPRVRKGHGYLLNKVKECSSISHTMRYGNYGLTNWYLDLVKYERTMYSQSRSMYERDERRRQGLWW